MLKKIGRWTAARLQGSKGKEKYDDWMRRNPWASTALTIGDVALAGYAAPKLIGGLKGMLTAQGGATVTNPSVLADASSMGRNAAFEGASAASTAPAPVSLGERARAGFQAAKSAPSAFSAAGRQQAMGNLGDIGRAAARGGRAVFDYAKANPLAGAMALEGLLTGSQAAQQMRIERARDRREQERREMLAQLLMPTFAQYYRGE